ncbi:Type ii site-specific deoxyribonuclease [hydrothermal vent metagenome]|uniref:Type ii site-specific deoxyribonuclease n=1 Tax=hydrothermal vent metagenome TaxID=652676 RepID=A0A3B0UU87_9ZZZZ
MMSSATLFDLQASVKDKSAFRQIEDYYALSYAFLNLLIEIQPTRIVSPNDPRYIFYQFDKTYRHKITRPLNSDLFIEATDDFQIAFERFISFLGDLKRFGQTAINKSSIQEYLKSNEVNKIVYTCQQIIGSIGDSFENPNQSRKRVGQLFENLVKLLIKEIGFACESRTISVPIPDSPDYMMSYELDLVFSKNGAIIASEHELIHPGEIIGSVKTTSKDRIDKIFLDKFLLTKLLGREIKVIAIFLHDVQRARRANSIFGINSTFKTNHFLGYTVALNRLDGVYFVDPRPNMVADFSLRSEIDDFQYLLVNDIWRL